MSITIVKEENDPWNGRRCKMMRFGTDQQCKAYAVGGDQFCSFHAMDDATRREAQRKGGANNARYIHIDTMNRPGSRAVKRKLQLSQFADIVPNPAGGPAEEVTLDSPDDVKKLLADTINDVRNGRVSHEKASMVSALCNTLLSAMVKTVGLGGKEADRPMPEITEIERSSDPRTESADYPGSEYGREDVEKVAN